jgi:hypothetical protein
MLDEIDGLGDELIDTEADGDGEEDGEASSGRNAAATNASWSELLETVIVCAPGVTVP